MSTRVLSKLKEYALVLFVAVVSAYFIKTFFVEAYRIPTASMENTLLIGDFIVVNKLLYGAESPKYFPILGWKIPTFKVPSIRTPEHNDVVVFKFPGNKTELFPSEDVNYIKRLIGKPGDTVSIKNKTVYLNGEAINNPALTLIKDKSVKPEEIFSENIFPVGKSWNEDNYGPLVVPKKGLTISLDLYNINEWKNLIDREHGKRVVEVDKGLIKINGIPVTTYKFKKDYCFMLGDNRDDSLDSRYWGFVSAESIIGIAMIIYWSVDSDAENYFSSFRINRIFSAIE